MTCKCPKLGFTEDGNVVECIETECRFWIEKYQDCSIRIQAVALAKIAKMDSEEW
ncbi:MAG: hypothetical protein GF411_12950 [Candidatus Lokiarchaeota archaeon]|nr:hypothetical protein [Candidatus Lokiarchaeota archaeon]